MRKPQSVSENHNSNGRASMSLLASCPGRRWFLVRCWGVWLAVALHAGWVEAGCAAGVPGGSGRDQDVVDGAAGRFAGADLDAAGVDALFVCEILLDVERTFGGGLGLLRGVVLAHNYKDGGGLAI